MTTTPISVPASPAPVPPSPLTQRLSPVAGIVLLVFLACGLLFCIWSMAKGKLDLIPDKLDRDAVFHGEITHHIAKELAKSPFAEKAANLERGASWLLIGDTGPRVHEGCPGWLFIADETKIHRHAVENAAAKAHIVTTIREQLAKRNIELLVAVVPDKSRIAAAQLCHLPRPALLATRVGDWVASLDAAGVAAIDLAPTLQPLGEKAYLRTDTHWSETGAAAAAGVIAGKIKGLGITPTPTQAYDSAPGEAKPRPGDLVRLAGLDWLPASLQPPQEIVTPTVITARAAEDAGDSLDDLFGDSNLPNVALIGTSYSRNSNFVPFLESDLSAPVGNFARDGGEFAGAAKDYFTGIAFKQTPPRLLIWEINERDLQSPYVDQLSTLLAP
jgi:alginate O-acetyltransferase complex protein AlgJ